MLKTRLQQTVFESKNLLWKAMSVHLIPTVMILAQVMVFWVSAKVGFFPGSERFQSIIATCSEIIAGLYGITMAGYTFFLSRIDALTDTDGTLDYVVASIKNRFKYLIWYITSNVLMTLMISILLMYVPEPAGEEMGFFYRLFCNEFLMFVAFSVVLILYYSVQVINPNCIEKEARKLKYRMGGSDGSGDAVEFIACYGKIVEKCNAMLPPEVLHQLRENKGRQFELTLGLLEEQKLLIKPMLADIRRIHRYYECVVNCGNLSVSREMCHMAKNVLQNLDRPVPTLLGKL